MGKRRSAPSGLDYVPIPGKNPDFVFGVVRSTLAGETHTATAAVARRLFPVKPLDLETCQVLMPTCFRFDVTLPSWAPNDYQDPLVLTRAYDDQAWDGLKDLVVMMNFRFPETAVQPPTQTLHAAYELVRGFACERLSVARDMASVIAMHVPARAAQAGVPHVHVMGLARTCGPTGFGDFIRPLATDAAARSSNKSSPIGKSSTVSKRAGGPAWG